VTAPPNGRSVDVLAVGRSSLDLYAQQVGVPITGVAGFSAYVGGCPTNVSVGARRLGLRSAALTAVGDDQVGDFVLHFLRQEGVDTQFVPRKAGRRTSAVVLTMQPPDRFPVTFYRDNCADRELTVDDVRAAPVADCRAVFLTGTGLTHEPSRSATLFAAEVGRQSQSLVVVDLDYRPDQWANAAAYANAMPALLSFAHVVIGTEEEAVAAANEGDVERAVTRLRGLGPGTVVVKRGPRGATVFDSDRSIDVPPFAVKVLNTLGAGDAFASAFLHGCLSGSSMARSVRAGNAAGAILVTKHGCANFMPTLKEIDAFVDALGGWTWDERHV
jgi:5-dehydro-2-deoxygluconokinase